MMQRSTRTCTICNNTPAFPVSFDGGPDRFRLDMCARDAMEFAPDICQFWRDVAARSAPPKSN